MKKTSLLQMGVLTIIAFSVTIASCSYKKKMEALELAQLPFSTYTINGKTFTSSHGTNNKTLKAIEIPCENNNTIHLYYSAFDSSRYKLFFNSPTTEFKVVSYAKAGNLKSDECYLEVNTSANDTWLSTGTDNKKVTVTVARRFNAGEDVYYYDFSDIMVQHWTGMPLNDFGKVLGSLASD